MVHEAHLAGLEAYLEQVDPARAAACERPRGAPAACEGIRSEALARREARSRAPGLDLDHHQRAAIDEHEVELAPARAQASRQEAPAASPQRALDQALAGERVEWIAGRETAQEPARREAQRESGEEPPGETARR